jgi:hypothetical protein
MEATTSFDIAGIIYFDPGSHLYTNLLGDTCIALVSVSCSRRAEGVVGRA